MFKLVGVEAPHTCIQLVTMRHCDPSGTEGLTFPRCLIHVEARDREFKVSRICETVGAQRTQLRELKMGAKDFQCVLTLSLA